MPYKYCIAGKFGEFGESFVIHQTKTIQISTYNYNLLAESIHLPNFFCQTFLPNAQNDQTHQTFSPPNFPTIWYQLVHIINKSSLLL